jgi:hypothetical protein
LVKQLNAYRKKEIEDYEFIKVVCTYFDKVKDLDFLSPSDLKFLKYISNVSGIPHYYDLLFSKFNHTESFVKYDLKISNQKEKENLNLLLYQNMCKLLL